MDDEYLLDRILALEAELSTLDRLLSRTVAQGAALPHGGHLRKVEARLGPVVGRIVDPLRQELVQARREPAGTVAERWRTVEALAHRVSAVAADLLPLVEGALATAAGVDSGMSAVAQDLLDELAASTAWWNRVVVPGPAEATRDRTWVIGLPLRDADLWSLPIMVHELGHFAAARLEDQHGQLLGKELLDGSWRQGRAGPPLPYPHAVELFADVFASYCVGPAFGAALLARAIPADAWKSTGTHPAWGSRLRAVDHALVALEHLLPDVDRNLSWVTKWVRDDWAAALAAAGSSDAPPAAVAEAVDAFARAAVDVMERTAPRARFDGADVLALGELLRRGAPPPAGADRRAVLNAAWAERLRSRDKIATIEQVLRRWALPTPAGPTT